MTASSKSTGKKRHVPRPDVRETLLLAAEKIVREEGYAAATARRIASEVGMRHQAVFYYFGSQDELLMEVLHRSMEAHKKCLQEAIDSPQPLRAMWNLISNPEFAKIGLEFLALANHNEMIRAELAKNSERLRELETEGIARYLEQRGIKPRVSPQMVSIMTSALARLLVQESTLGIHGGHEEVEALVERSLSHFEASGEANDEVEPIVGAASTLE
ncbi:TetR/AcrR family transcriptional regulator [Pseudomaricurvus sp. HS19]|uniref:TetR/AcrR family transcriptional regulator n=1 Tax=Pseudomaricurvus sp. HS19 TaxID=2692626 RepID=UPI0013706585|nr:TetR/AcrR family transcriptional regulator [Pseudomaricurvus sp. HS19]MYM62816.1 TetR family transcriptional regulator [Pseudomaricurvus sp. HS19]